MSTAALRKTIRRCTALLVTVLSMIAVLFSSLSQVASDGNGTFFFVASVSFLGSILYLCESAL